MVDEQWYIIADIEIVRFCWKISKLGGLKSMLNFLMDIRIYFSIKPLLLQGLLLCSLKIHELFWDVKMENGVLGEYKKTLDTKRSRILKRNC